MSEDRTYFCSDIHEVIVAVDKLYYVSLNDYYRAIGRIDLCCRYGEHVGWQVTANEDGLIGL